MKLKFLAFIAFLFFSFSGFSQNMKEGFTYLETGKYNQAETFFKEVLKTHPTNKTARLCYGRAVGLTGNSKEAVTLFTSLLKDFPTDFEVKLNYAEALLWDKQYDSAKNFYEKLIKENNTSFPALLGYANTLSNLKLFKKAIVYVDKALVVLPGNKNALVSKKYMRLGLANDIVKTQNYLEAENILKENFTDFKNDKETLLNLANLYLISNQIEKAKKTYEIIGENPENKLTSLNGIALANHLDDNNKQALIISEKAINLLTNKTDTLIKNKTKERYIQALIWNKKYRLAEYEINNLLLKNKEQENWILSLRASLNIYKSNFKKSIDDFNLILKKDSVSFDGNLGKANAEKASGLFNNAYNSANKTLSIFNNQKDALNFINILDKQFTPYVETMASYSFDNGNNEAILSTTNVTVPLSTKLQVNGVYSFRDSKNTVTNNQAKANNILLGVSYLLHPKIGIRTQVGITDIKAKTTDYTQFLTDIVLNLKPVKLQTLDLGFKRQWQDFNADLLSRAIEQNTLYANYNVNTNFKLGWFTQYNYTWQNDNNVSHLLFTSLYYNLLDKPVLKAGLNYQHITFKDQVPSIYFSPEKFNVYEVFLELVKNQKGKWFYNLNVATGLQYIEDQEQQSTYRFQGKLGYNISNRFTANLYGLHSNIASATAAGFTFTEIGLRLKWDLFKKPIFR